MYRRHLPHIQPKGYTFFVTFRLAGSLPANVIRELQMEYRRELGLLREKLTDQQQVRETATLRKRYFGKYDALIDGSSTGPVFLKEPVIAQVIREALLFRDGSLFTLYAFTIMPNHVHMLFRPLTTARSGKVPIDYVSRLVGNLKSYTAKRANLLLKRQGGFWQEETYDHLVRNDAEFWNIHEYILNNPVKAGLVEKRADFRWNYSKYEGMVATE